MVTRSACVVSEVSRTSENHDPFGVPSWPSGWAPCPRTKECFDVLSAVNDGDSSSTAHAALLGHGACAGLSGHMAGRPGGKIADQDHRPPGSGLAAGAAGLPSHALLPPIGHTVSDTGAYFMATRQLRSVSIGREIGAS